jgi:hypothetical protein
MALCKAACPVYLRRTATQAATCKSALLQLQQKTGEDFLALRKMGHITGSYKRDRVASRRRLTLAAVFGLGRSCDRDNLLPVRGRE